MMLNYMRSEWYRIVHGREFYVFTGVLCALVLAAIGIHFIMMSTPDFPYATVRFTLGIMTSSLLGLLLLAGTLAWILFADDRKNGTLRNAIATGYSRRRLFVGKCLVGTAAGLLCLVVVLVAYIGSAVLLLEGPAAQPVHDLLMGALSALPSAVASVVLVVAVFSEFENTGVALIVWVAVMFVIPYTLRMIGLLVEPIAVVASWLPTNFFSTEALVSMSGSSLLWNTPAGLAKCLISGFVGIALFGAVGLWRAGKTEL